MATAATNAAAIEAVTKQVSDIGAYTGAHWAMYGGSLVFLMQAGFALLESGCVRPKNTQAILFKNLLDASIGAFGWYALGCGIAFGEDNKRSEKIVDENGMVGYGGFLGTNGFFSRDKHLNGGPSANTDWSSWFFQFTFCATAATIVSGAMAERSKLCGFALVSLWLSAFVYPVVVHWTWGAGWLAMDGFVDLAGSGVVHLVGGTAGLVGAIVLGPRIGRFDGSLPASEFSPSSYAHITLGTFLLWFGWFAFNGCSNGIDSNGGQDAGRSMVNTTLSAGAGGLTSFLLQAFTGSKKYDVGVVCNCILGGLVGITAGCDGMKTHLALITGMISCFVVLGTSKLLKKLHIDDVIDAFAVHGACGAWGCIAIGFFHMDKGLFYDDNKFTRSKGKGCLGPNIVGICAIAAWTIATTLPLFLGLKFAGLLRATPEDEEVGLDLTYFEALSHDQDAIMSQQGSPRIASKKPEIELPTVEITAV